MSNKERLLRKRNLLSEEMEVQLGKFRVQKRNPSPVFDGKTIFQVANVGFGPNRGVGSVISRGIGNGLELYRADIYGNIVYAKSEVSDIGLGGNSTVFPEEAVVVNLSERGK